MIAQYGTVLFLIHDSRLPCYLFRTQWPKPEMKKAAHWIRCMLVLMLTSAASGLFVKPEHGVETVRVATPGKLVDFSALYVGTRLGLYQKEGLNLEFIVMRTGIHYAALQAGEVDYTTLVTSTIRAAIAGMPVRVVLALNNRQPFFLLSQPEIRDGKQLKGKRIAVSAFGSSTDTGARKILKHFGLDANRDAVMLALGDTGLRAGRPSGPFHRRRHAVASTQLLRPASGIQQSDVDGRSRRRRTTHQRTEHDGKKDQRTAGSASAHAQGYCAQHGLCPRKQR